MLLLALGFEKVGRSEAMAEAVIVWGLASGAEVSSRAGRIDDSATRAEGF